MATPCLREAAAKAGKIRGVLLGGGGALSVLGGILPVLASTASTGSFFTHERMWSEVYNELASTWRPVPLSIVVPVFAGRYKTAICRNPLLTPPIFFVKRFQKSYNGHPAVLPHRP